MQEFLKCFITANARPPLSLLISFFVIMSIQPSNVCLAEPTIESDASSATRHLEVMTIEDEGMDEAIFDVDRSISTINRESIENRQSGNVMELLQDIPGVSIEGGPRTGGMRISIRGFDSNEDVLTKIDGATQNFEKYRYGIGLSIDPDLLKQVEVSRGSAVLTRGSGALGGVVEMETVDARDLLGADEYWGLRAKYGHRFNNDSDQFTLTGMASPFDFMDVLLSGVKRQSNDYTLPDGHRYPDSEETQLSGLGKVELYTDNSEFSFGYRFSEESGREPFDATGGGPGVGGTVFRTSKEKSYTFIMRLQPESEWLDIKASIGFTDKNLTDEESDIASGTDIFQYDIWTAEVRNQSSFDVLNAGALLTFGGQFNQETRDAIRINSLGTQHNPAQPPGSKTSYGIFMEQQVFIDDFIFSAGLRGDYYAISAKADTADILTAQQRPTRIDFFNLSPAFSVTYQPGNLPLTLFYSYAELFRSPLVDEYFTVPPTSRCATFSAFQPLPALPARDDFPAGLAGTLAWIDALNQHPAQLAAAEQDPYSENNAICADYYQPEQSQNHEIGLSFSLEGLLTRDDLLSSKLTFFYTHVDHTLESIYQNTVTGEISQPGLEVHHGFEFDLRYDSEHYFVSLALSTLDGYRQLNYFDNNSNLAVSGATTSADQGKEDLVNSPADKLIFTLGRKFPEYQFKIGYRLEAYADRLVTIGTRQITGCSGGIFVVPSCFENDTQKGYVLHDLFATWKPWQDTAIRLNIDNLTNSRYSLPGFGGGEGVTAPGIDIRLSISQQL